jgi:hypothetical protein
MLFRSGFVLGSSFSFAFLVSLAVACGDKSGQEPATPNQASSSSPKSEGSGPGASAASSSGSASSSSSGGGTTTTTQLGDGGDLQGARLGSKVHSETETKGESGPKSTGGQSAEEPGRTVKDIQTIVASRRDEARACYDKGLAKNPGIEGDLDIKWVIDPQGNVTSAMVDTSKSSILEPSVGACVVEVIKKIKFAASAKGYETRAHYPFNFHPKTFSAKDAGK